MGIKDDSGLIIVLSAPSGAGKTTLCRKLKERNPQLDFSLSYTTRRPRQGEKDGRDYFFISRDDFSEKKQKGFFAEWAEVHGAFYGTSRVVLDEAVKKGKDIVLTIDVQGASQVKKKYPRTLTIFILSPTFEDLKERLEGRKTEGRGDIEKRLEQAKEEIKLSARYDYKITNRKIAQAVRELEEKINIEKSKLKK